MFSHSKVLIIILVLILVFLSACGSAQAVSPVDPGEDGEQQVVDSSNDTWFLLHYHFLLKHPDAEATFEPLIPMVAFLGSNPGSYKVSGVTDINVQLRMGAGTDAERCNVNCNIDLKFTAEGEITLDENTGKCIIPMTVTFTPKADDWIMESDCPLELQEVLNCATMSLHFLDPSVYTFEANRRDITQPTGNGATLRAELKNFAMPADLEGVCDW